MSYIVYIAGDIEGKVTKLYYSKQSHRLPGGRLVPRWTDNKEEARTFVEREAIRLAEYYNGAVEGLHSKRGYLK